MKTITDTEVTKVKFIKDKTGEITAVFPEIEEVNNSFLCYAHIGQHGVAYPLWIKKNTVPAKKIEYNDLKAELESIGYKLVVLNRK